MEPRRDPPEPVKRILRQEAGFGCCICGRPFIEYHHIVPYSDDPHYRLEDMMALCPYCHAMVTSGAMSAATQREHKRRPINITEGFSKGRLVLEERECVVVLGGNLFVGGGDVVHIDGETLLGIRLGEENRLEISMALYDKDGATLVRIDRNEWISGDPQPWDIEFGFNRMTVRRKSRDISLDINATRDPILIRAKMWKAGNSVEIDPHLIRINSTGVQNFRVTGSTFKMAGLIIDSRTLSAGIHYFDSLNQGNSPT